VPRRRERNSRNPRRWSSVRLTRTKGSGASQTKSYRTGGISITGVGPTGRVASSRPTVRATVRDQGSSLSKQDTRLYFDGSEKTRFHYDQASGRLSYYVGGALSPGTHEVKIEAEAESSDNQGQLSQWYGQKEMELHGGASLKTRKSSLHGYGKPGATRNSPSVHAGCG